MKEFYTVDEAAKYLETTRKVILGYIYNSLIDHIHVNGRFLISKKALDEEITRNRKQKQLPSACFTLGISPGGYRRLIRLGYLKEGEVPNITTDAPNFRKYCRNELAAIFGVSAQIPRLYIRRYNYYSKQNQRARLCLIKIGNCKYLSENDLRKLLIAHPDKVENNKLLQLIMYDPKQDEEIARLREEIRKENNGKYKIY